MASIKEEVMTVKDDCQYVRALDANGNSIRISKEDLAKVLGELMGIKSYPKTSLKIGESIEIALSGKSPFILSIYAGEANNTEYLAEVCRITRFRGKCVNTLPYLIHVIIRAQKYASCL